MTSHHDQILSRNRHRHVGNSTHHGEFGVGQPEEMRMASAVLPEPFAGLSCLALGGLFLHQLRQSLQH